MPIVDGLTSTKMIRSFEKTHPNVYSSRVALYGRVPIIAVSASLLEQNRQRYVDAGFDAWILKPIAFDRLQKLMAAAVDSTIRRECLYKRGEWEKGGWFHTGQKSVDDVSTKPSDETPILHISQKDREAIPSDPIVDTGTKNEGGASKEQEQLLQPQEKAQTSEAGDQTLA